MRVVAIALLAVGVGAAQWGPVNEAFAQRDSDAGAKTDSNNRLVPPQNTAYDKSRAKSCCIASCQEDQGCEDGCRNWLLQSSLNYESDKWWDGLRKKCERDCERRDIYAGHNMLLFTAAQKAKALKAWWMTHHKTTDAAQCKVGCHHFRLCMNVFLNEAAPAKQWHGLFD